MATEPEHDETEGPDVSVGTTLGSPPPTHAPGPAGELPGEVDWSKLMGSQAERYEYVRRLGAGGMGVVYLAHDKKLQRRVAIKAIRGMASERMYRRLLREAQALAKLSHPNVVQVYDVDVMEDELRVSMEYIEGRNLREWLEREPDLHDILRVFIEASKGLAAAHKANLIHRDFKPDNVLIDDEGQVRVADFGIARSNDGAEHEPSDAERREIPQNLTQTGQFLGSPPYMAPELFDDKPGTRGDALSDQYAFCVSLFEALYGELPFRATSFWALVNKITSGEVQEPEPGSMRLAVPKSVRAAIARGMSRDPALRFASMTDLGAALQRAAKAAKRRPARLIALAVGVVVVVAVGGVVLVRQLDARAYERECLAPARTLYASGTRNSLDAAREVMMRCEVRRHDSDAAAELLRVDAALLYGAGDESSRAAIGSSRSADARVAEVGAALWQVGVAADELELAGYLDLWARVREQAGPWLDALERAGHDPQRTVAPENHLWLMALIVALAPDAGVTAEDLGARLDAAIEQTRDHVTNKPQYLLVRFRAELEHDHERAADLLGRYLDERWTTQDGASELVELLLAERAYRLALAAHASAAEQLLVRAQVAMHPDGKPLTGRAARLDLAEVLLGLRAGDDPGKLRASLDRSLAEAPRLWWDVRFITALSEAEALVIRREQIAKADAEREELLADYYRHKSLTAAEAIARAEQLRAAGDDSDELARLITDAREPEPGPEHDDATATKTLVRPKRVVQVQVTFNKGEFNGAAFEIEGRSGVLQATPNLSKSLAAKPQRFRCQALLSDGWSAWATITPEEGMTLRCTKQGVKIAR